MPSRSFMFLEKRVADTNYMELVRHTSMRVRFAYSPSCKRCMTFKRVLDYFPQIESVSTHSSRYKRHHYMLEVAGDQDDDVYDYRLPDTDHGYKLRDWVVQNFFLSKEFAPQDHQAAFVAGFEGRELPRGIAMIWQVGSGKSHGALNLLKKHGAEHIVIVCNISLIQQWVDTVKQQAGDVHVEIYGFDRFEAVVSELSSKQRGRFLEGSYAIVDEYHRFKNQRDSMENSVQALLSADSVLILSGTPARNDVTDINITLRFLDLEQLIPEGSTSTSDQFLTAEDVRTRGNAYASPELLRRILRACSDGRVSVYNPRFGMSPARFRSHFPSTHEADPVYHDMNYYQLMALMISGSGTMVPIKGKMHPIGRRGGAWTRLPYMAGVDDTFTGELRSSKPDAIIGEVKSIQATRGPDRQYPFVIYSRFKTDLLVPVCKILQDFLEAEGRDPTGAQLLTGDTKVGMRKTLIKQYNDGKLDFLLICRVGNEGLDLKYPAAGMFMLEPQSTEAEEKQVFGRVVRLHTKRLPKDMPPIEMRRFISQYPTRDPSEEEGQYLLDFVFNDPRLMRAFHFVETGQVDGDEVLAWLRERIAATGGITEEEHTYQANKEKSKRIEPIMAVLWGASALFASGGAVPVPKQQRLVGGEDPDIATNMPREWRIKLQQALKVKTDDMRESEKKQLVVMEKAAKVQAKEADKSKRKRDREKVRDEAKKLKATAKAQRAIERVSERAEKIRVKGKTKGKAGGGGGKHKSKVGAQNQPKAQKKNKKRPRPTDDAAPGSKRQEAKPTQAATDKRNARRRTLYNLHKQEAK
jgi:superfamily II DNA or RNA helicase